MKKAIILIVWIISTIHPTCFAQFFRWERVDSLFYGNYYFPFVAVDCYDDDNCIYFGNLNATLPVGRVTTDGGKTWRTAIADTNGWWHYYFTGMLLDVSYPDSSLCIAVADSHYYYISRDRCRTWEKKKFKNLPYPTPSHPGVIIIPSAKVKMYNNKIGLVMAVGGELLYTYDGGDTWGIATKYFPDTIPQSIQDICWLTESKCQILLSTKETNYILESIDSAKNFYIKTSIPKGSFNLFYLDSLSGWSAGGLQINTGSKIRTDMVFHTSDGGQTWELQLDTIQVPPLTGLRKVFFKDQNYGIAIGPYWNMWITTNGGKTWFIDTSFNSKISPNRDLVDIYYKKNGEVIAVTSENYVWVGYPLFSNYAEPNDLFDSNQKIKIFSNVVIDFLEIFINKEIDKSNVIEIYNFLGNCVLTYKIDDSLLIRHSSFKIDISNIPCGFYLLKIGGVVTKFLKMF